MNRIYSFDGSFDGFLSAIFSVYRAKDEAPAFRISGAPGGLFDHPVEVVTESDHARRVGKAVEGVAGRDYLHLLYRAFLSEEPDVEQVLFRCIRDILADGAAAAENLLLPHILHARNLARRTSREVHRMHAFVRFIEVEGGAYRAIIDPACDVLPLIGDHFERRFPAMRWAILDVRRTYAIVHEPREPLRFVEEDSSPEIRVIESEETYQRLWNTYLKAVNIPERRNPELQSQHMPRRYWRYLTERNAEGTVAKAGHCKKKRSENYFSPRS
jgi:probable DNA metabolism protein